MYIRTITVEINIKAKIIGSISISKYARPALSPRIHFEAFKRHPYGYP
jgi:hypothetical protein